MIRGRQQNLKKIIAIAGAIVLAAVVVLVAVRVIPDGRPAPGSGARPKVGYIGDSLTVGGLPEGLQESLNRLGYDSGDLMIDGLVGRSIVDGNPPFVPSSQQVVNTWRSNGYHPDIWVIALISNDFGKSKQEIKDSVNKLLEVIDDEPVTRVLWVGPVVRPGSTLQPQVDDNMYPALREVAAERAGSIDVELLDLQGAIRDRRLDEAKPPLWTDDRHMTSDGYRLRNDLIVEFCRAHGLGGS